VIVRDGDAIPPRGGTVLRAGDQLYVLTRPELRDQVERLFEDWRGD
jgi:Trk K+ transport system NAD-binding subunit